MERTLERYFISWQLMLVPQDFSWSYFGINGERSTTFHSTYVDLQFYWGGSAENKSVEIDERRDVSDLYCSFDVRFDSLCQKTHKIF